MLLTISMGRVRLIVPAAMLAALCVASIARNSIFDTEVDLYSSAVERSPGKARPHNNLGDALKKAGRIDEALTQFEQALIIKPDYPDAMNNLATVYNFHNRRQEARTLLLHALELQPGHIQARYNLAMTLYDEGLIRDAEEQFRVIILLRPGSSEAAFARKMLAMMRPDKGR